MKLDEYIQQVGRRKAAEEFGVSIGLIGHWLTGRRHPSAKLAMKIVETTPVTWEGIYGTRDHRPAA